MKAFVLLGTVGMVHGTGVVGPAGRGERQAAAVVVAKVVCKINAEVNFKAQTCIVARLLF